jgi:predicted HAD superfamily Cof-like phosphohydrolase
MTNPFHDQAQFMRAFGQTVNQRNGAQFMLYYALIKEEMGELIAAYNTDDRAEQLDALIDILVVTIGALHSMGCYPEDAWNEVMRTNFAKVDPATGKVTRREDGKILKPEGWQPPRLERYLHD